MNDYLPGLEAERRDLSLSQYFTPPRTAARIAEFALRRMASAPPVWPLRVLEPSCGKGALIHALLDIAPGMTIVGVDIDKRNVDATSRPDLRIVCADFLETYDWKGFDLVVTNPPFEDGAAEAHILHALKFAPSVVAHVPLTTLASRERHEGMWSKCRLDRLAICSTRPKYGAEGGKTDMCTIEVSAYEHDPKAPELVHVEFWK